MYVSEGRFKVEMTTDEAWTIACCMIEGITKNVPHYTEHGYEVFLKNEGPAIAQAKLLAGFTNPRFIDQKLEAFKTKIESKA